MSKRDEVPPAMSWAAFWATLSTLVTAACALVPWFADLPGWMAVVAQAAAGVVFVGLASVVVRESPMFAAIAADGRGQIMTLLRAGAVANTVWAAAFAIRRDLWFWWLLALVALGIVEYWVARGHQYLVTRIARQPIIVPPSLDGEAQDHTSRIMRAALDEAGKPWLKVLSSDVVGGDEPFGAYVEVQVPSRMAMTRAEQKGVAALSPVDAEPIAIALGEVTRRPIESNWVQITKQPAAGRYRILVVDRDVMAGVRPYRDPLAWSTSRTPKIVGYGMDGEAVPLSLRQHGQITGATQWGKSSLINVEWAELTLCQDAIIWTAGVEKLYDFVADWIEPYAGQDLPPPIDWIASGQDDLLKMLVVALTVARWRQKRPMDQRRGFMDIFIYLDEASFALRNSTAKAMYQGRMLTASELLGACTQATASAGIYFRFISQRGTVDHFGAQGGDVKANAGFAAAFRSRDGLDAGRVTGDYRLPAPSHPGQCWLEAGTGPVQVKVPYLQTSDPSKRRYDGCPLTRDVAWDRRHFPRALDAGSAAAAGDAYAGRHTRMGPAMLAYLTDSEIGDEAAVVASAVPPAVEDSDGYRAVSAALRERLAGAGQPVEREPGRVVALAGRRPRAERIVAVVAASPVPLDLAGIRAALHAQGDDATSQVVTNALTKLVQNGQLLRPRTGVYAAVESRRVSTHTHT